jgi:hypothetical protein
LLSGFDSPYFAVSLDVILGRMLGVLSGMNVVPVSQVRVMRGCLVVAA